MLPQSIGALAGMDVLRQPPLGDLSFVCQIDENGDLNIVAGARIGAGRDTKPR